MCGRYSLTTSLDELVEEFDVRDVVLHDIQPRYNIAPGQLAPVVVRGREGVKLGELLWGFVPHWAEKPGPRVSRINARAETAATLPAFRDAFRRHRCVVPADGFYEWSAGAPHWIHRTDRGVLAFAGLWDRWRPQGGGEPLLTFCVLTVAANATLRSLHDRMPVILSRQDRDVWLDPEASSQALAHLLRPSSEELLEAWPVSKLVNSAVFDEPACIVPLSADSH
jgi:putative SOS response-associated peptidase YedK